MGKNKVDTGYFEEFHQKRNFLGWFKKKKVILRSGAKAPDKVKKEINDIGIDKIIEITRIGYDGEIDDIPLIVKIVDVSNESFSAVVVNPERSLIEQSTSQTIYAKKGGGHVDFNFDDGDIYSIDVSKDEDILNEAKNVDQLKELVAAFEVGDPILLCYWETSSKGTINVKGDLVEKSDDSMSFSIKINSTNNIELEDKKTVSFNLEKDLVIDLQYAG
ncbi:MAG: hypothetical protein KAR38_10080 [Calditrichia bacterium]|nr:hypothetical protein [Calditrichia bacterium]